MVLQSGKPLIVSQAADPVSDRKVIVEVKATSSSSAIPEDCWDHLTLWPHKKTFGCTAPAAM